MILAQCEKVSGPTAKAIDTYKRTVLESVEHDRPEDPDPAVLESAWKLAIDFRADVATYKKRRNARADLDVRVPALAARARQLQQVADEAAAIGSRLVSEFSTLGELLAALNETARHATGGMVSPQKLSASQAANEVSMVRQGALTLLKDTSDPDIGIAIQELQGVAASIESSIANRSDIIGVDVAIARQEARLLDITTGGRDRLTTADLRKPDKQVYREARQRLEALHTLAAQKPAAIEANAADRAHIDE